MLLIFASPAIYFVSLGPVCWMADRGYIQAEWCDTYAFPADYVAEFVVTRILK
jgi:hypothetical protein